MAVLNRYIMVTLLAALASASVWGYVLYQRNQTLSLQFKQELATSAGLREARKKDAYASQRLIESMVAEQERLAERLQTLSEIQDEHGRTYLDSTVPDSVRSLLNR